MDKDGKMHRADDLPAIEGKDGSLAWKARGTNHRDGDMPSVVKSDGTLEWWSGDLLHREGGLPAIVRPDGTMEYYVRGKRHSFMKPALQHVNSNSDEWWFFNTFQSNNQSIAYAQARLTDEIIESIKDLPFEWAQHMFTRSQWDGND